MIDINDGPYYNWNRISMLTHAGIRSDEHSIESDELRTRYRLQNMYACTSDNKLGKVFETIQLTITPEIQKAVDIYMAKYNQKSNK